MKNVSISKKLAIAFGTALALVVAVGLFGLLQLHLVNSVATEFRDAWLPRIERLNTIKRSIAEHRILATRRTQTTNFHHLAAINASMEETLNTLRTAEESYAAAGISPEERNLFEQYRALWAEYDEILRGVLRRLETGEAISATVDFDTISSQSFERTSAKLDELIDLTRQQSEQAAARAHDGYRRARYWTLAVIVLASFCTGAAITWASRNVSSPILSISDAMRRLSAGDHSATVSSTGGRGDEIGVLIDAVTGYRDTLVRAQQLAEEAERERQRLNAAITNMPIGLSMFDRDQRLIVCNDRYREIYQLPKQLTRPGTPLREILEARRHSGNLAESDPAEYIRKVLGVIQRQTPALNLVELENGRVISIIHQPMAGGGWVSTHEDVTESRRAEARIRHMARHDALTDLPNRVLLKERIEDAIKRIVRGDSLAVLCLDLDRFKSVNDTLGHPIGDALLVAVADRLRDCVRETDTVARLGGDEFAIVQAGVLQQPEAATVLAQRVIEALSKPFEVDGHQIVIGTSIGIAIAPADGNDADQLLKNGDMALYRAKSDGRGIYRFFEPEMDARMQARRALELDLRRGLLQREFELHYQPVVNVDTNEITGFEALIRWRHPQRGMVSPAEFIPVAEEIGLIVPIGEWVLKQACLDAQSWPESIRVSVNLSPAQFRSKKLLEAVVTALAVSKLAPNRLELEITEGVLLVEHEETLALLHQLRALGVRIAMDDFGTGYSSLSYLRSFPFNKIKIDRSFIRNISDEESSLAIIRAVTGLSQSLGMATTAEGVETTEQMDRVRAEGCTEVQGFLISAARPASEVPELLRAQRVRTHVAA